MILTYTTGAYVAYLGLSGALTIWVARTLVKNGRIFLVDAFQGNQPLADSINHLLAVGFYLVNLGWITLHMETYTDPASLAGSMEVVAGKLGGAMILLGVMHFFNLWLFARMRRKGLLQQAPPPVLPNEFLAPRVAARAAVTS